MFLPLFIAFLALEVWDYIQEGGSFIFLARFMEWYTSFGKSYSSVAKKSGDCMYVEIQVGKNTYGLMCPMGSKMDWKVAIAQTSSGNLMNVTDEMLYFAGPYRNFYNLPSKISHFNSDYTKVTFVWTQEDTVEVQKNDIILQKFKERLKLKSN